MTEEVIAAQPEAELTQPATPASETVADEGVETPQADEKKFTQTELNEIIQKRIAKAEAIAERRALKVYAQKLEGMTQKTAPPVQAQASDGKPSMAQFSNVEDYVEAVSDWKLNQRDQATKQQHEERQRQTVAEKANDIYARAEKVEGFDRDVFDSLPITEAVAYAIMDSDVPEKIMAHLAQNPAEANRLVALSPARQAAEIGKLEAKLSTVKDVQVSKAPAPISPVGAKGVASKDPSQMTDKEFADWRKRQIAQRR